jgi:hypothetical protein
METLWQRFDITTAGLYRSPEYDQEVARIAIANGEAIYELQINLWIDELTRSQMQGSYYFEALKVLLTSEYRECDLQICSVLDRQARISIRKPFFTGSTGDVERLTPKPVATSRDHSIPNIVHYQTVTYGLNDQEKAGQSEWTKKWCPTDDSEASKEEPEERHKEH